MTDVLHEGHLNAKCWEKRYKDQEIKNYCTRVVRKEIKQTGKTE